MIFLDFTDLGLFFGQIAIAIAVIFAKGQRVTVIPYGFWRLNW
ncbi:MAG: hypothetical protein ACRC78_10995 [Planktothrix sp.]